MHTTSRTTILTAVSICLLAGIAMGQTTVYNNFGPDHDGWDYNYGLGWTVAGVDVQQQFGVEQAMLFDCTVDGTLSDIWVAFWYVPLSADPDTVTLKLALNPNGLPPVEEDVLETWVMTDFDSWTQWNTPIHLTSDGATDLEAGQSYWLWAVAEEETWTGWCMNVEPSFTCPHAMRREGENWLTISNETASAFRVDVNEGPNSPSIALTPNNVPIQIPARWGSFSYNAVVANDSGESVTFDAWTEAVGPNGNTLSPIDLYPDRVFPAGHSVSLNLTQNVPWMIYSGTYTFRACVGTFPDIVIDSDEFTFDKLSPGGTGATVRDWSSSGWHFAATDGERQRAFRQTTGLTPVYPNPFNPTTTVSVWLPATSLLQVDVLNPLGQVVTMLADGQHAAGTHEFTFDGSGLSSGLYFVRMVVPGVAADRQKLVLMK